MADTSIVNNTTTTKEPSSDSHIKLQVVGQLNNTLNFQFKKAASFKKLKIAYSDRIGIPLDELRFFFEGRRIDDDDTPISLELEDMDIITVMQVQTGGGKGEFYF